MAVAANDRKPHYLVLYVEDDPVARELLNSALHRKFPDLELLTAENGKIGLELYKEHRPDLVLTDIHMPVMDGITMAEEIRCLRPDALITVISAFCDTNLYAERAEGVGINYCVSKPVDYRTLFTTIETCINDLAHARLDDPIPSSLPH